MSIFEQTLLEQCSKSNIEISDEQLKKMYAYHNKVVSAEFNLTSIKDEENSAIKHFFDSISPYNEIKENSKVIDVGSGGGFPIVPLAIMRKDIFAYALESNARKCDFIKKSCDELEINMEVICGRAEIVAQSHLRETFDVCVIRAVAGLSVIIEMCVPLIRPNGYLFAYKGDYKQEENAAKQAAKKLYVTLDKVIKMPVENYDHNILIYKKNKLSDKKYPRNFSQITKKPL